MNRVNSNNNHNNANAITRLYIIGKLIVFELGATRLQSLSSCIFVYELTMGLYNLILAVVRDTPDCYKYLEMNDQLSVIRLD